MRAHKDAAAVAAAEVAGKRTGNARFLSFRARFGSAVWSGGARRLKASDGAGIPFFFFLLLLVFFLIINFKSGLA